MCVTWKSCVIERNQCYIWIQLQNTIRITLFFLCDKKHLTFWNNTGKRIDHLSLGIQLVEGLFVKYANVLEHKMPGQHSSDNTAPRLTERYFVSKILPSEKKSRLQRLCVVCQKQGKRKETVYWCDACDGVCVECFCDYHTKLNF
jgi:hypothetical protein